MSRSHTRSASTATADPNHSDTHNIRPRSHPDAFSDSSSLRKPRGDDAGSDDSGMTSDDFEMDDIASDDGLEDDEETGLTGHDRQKRRKRKRRNTHLDQRVVPGSESQREEEDRLANKTFWSAVLLNALFIGLWCVHVQY